MKSEPDLPTKIVLIGPPGAGKSTVGGLLARAAGLDFHDSDLQIEAKTGKKISEIFVEQGEAIFREIEEGVVLDLLDHANGVLALGGGSVMNPRVEEWLKGSAKEDLAVIFLDVSIAHAAPRVGFNRERPLLMVNPRGSWQELMNKRRPVYEALATRVIDTNGRTPEEVVDEILLGWQR